MKTPIYLNVILTVIALFLAVLILEDIGIIRTSAKAISIEDGYVNVRGKISIDDTYPIKVTVK